MLPAGPQTFALALALGPPDLAAARFLDAGLVSVDVDGALQPELLAALPDLGGGFEVIHFRPSAGSISPSAKSLRERT